MFSSMIFRLFNGIRKELVEPRMRFSSGTSGSSSSGTSSSSGNTKPQLTKNEVRILTALKAMAVFLPGVYIGHVMTKQEIIGAEKDEDKDVKDKDGKDKDKKDKEGKDKDKKEKDGKDKDKKDQK